MQTNCSQGNGSPIDRPLLVSHKDAAHLVGMAYSTWKNYVSAGKTPEPIYLSGKMVRFKTAELESWVSLGCPPRGEWLQLREAERK